jgi:NAD(P)-dependent dehydrogenase (short-subunit alcohol dehydrogenase family)
MINSLDGKVVVITGANGCLGAAVSEKARSMGARLVLMDLMMPATQRPEDQWIEVDLLDLTAVIACADLVDRVDALFHIAGGFDIGPPVYELSEQQLESSFKLNVTTFQHVTKAFSSKMIRQRKGSIVSIGAMGAATGQAYMGPYCAAKNALKTLTESLSAEIKNEGVNVNCVLPSVINTPANRKSMPDAEHGRWVAPGDLAEVICFLGTEAARAIHGASIPVQALI